MSPASASTVRWWLTVGWLLPTGSSRLQLQADPSGAAATSDRSWSRTGSASTLNAAASSVACCSSSGPANSGEQHASMVCTSTNDSLAIIDRYRYIDVCPYDSPSEEDPCPACSSPSTSRTSTPPSTSTRSSSPPSRPSGGMATP